MLRSLIVELCKAILIMVVAVTLVMSFGAWLVGDEQERPYAVHDRR